MGKGPQVKTECPVSYYGQPVSSFDPTSFLRTSPTTAPPHTLVSLRRSLCRYPLYSTVRLQSVSFPLLSGQRRGPPISRQTKGTCLGAPRPLQGVRWMTSEEGVCGLWTVPSVLTYRPPCFTPGRIPTSETDPLRCHIGRSRNTYLFPPASSGSGSVPVFPVTLLHTSRPPTS